MIVITYNEEADLPGCLDSVQGLDAELVVVDNRSSDRTLEIARSRGAKTFTRDFDGYAPQKQFALEQATRRWVLSIDCDERVSPELAREIRDVVEHGRPEAGFEIPFEIHYLGRKLRFGGMGREKHLRLFLREKSRFVGGKIHEGTEVTGAVGRLSGKIEHYPYRDLDEHRAKIERYTTLMAERRIEEGSRATLLHFIVPVWEFLVRYVFRLGFLDGRPGLIYACMAAHYTRLKYSKMLERQRHAA